MVCSTCSTTLYCPSPPDPPLQEQDESCKAHCTTSTTTTTPHLHHIKLKVTFIHTLLTMYYCITLHCVISVLYYTHCWQCIIVLHYTVYWVCFTAKLKTNYRVGLAGEVWKHLAESFHLCEYLWSQKNLTKCNCTYLKVFPLCEVFHLLECNLLRMFCLCELWVYL